MGYYFDSFGYVFTFSICLQISIVWHTLAKEQQLFQGTNLSLNFVTRNKRVFQILKQPERCSYANLTTCHSEDVLHGGYFDSCYSDVCIKDNYYCLNNLYTGNTVHLCGKADQWNKRQRHVAIIDSIGSSTANVHTIDCPLGFIHLHKENSFDPCKEDVSIVIVKNKPDVVGVMARCNIEKNYCNSKGETTFELGSTQDSCFDAKYDLNLQCKNTEELMPDCTCSLKCEDGSKRVWFKGKYSCKTFRNSSSAVQNEESTEESKPSFSQKITTSVAQNIDTEIVNDAEVNIGDDIFGEAKTSDDKNDKAGLFQDVDAKEGLSEDLLIEKLHTKILKVERHESNTLIWNVMMVMIIIAAAIGIVLAVIGIVVLVKKFKIGRKCCRAVMRLENEELLSRKRGDDVAECKTKRVKETNKINTTTVNKTSIHFHADKANVKINQHRLTDRREEIENSFLCTDFTDRKAIKKEEDNLHEIVVHSPNENAIFPKE